MEPISNPSSHPSKAGVTALQSLWRGRQIRRHAVLPRQIASILRDRLIDRQPDEAVIKICIALGREILDFSSEKANCGHMTKIPGRQKRYIIPSDWNDQEQTWERSASFMLDYDIWLELSEDGKSIECQLIPISQKPIECASFKEVRKSQTLTLSLESSPACQDRRQGRLKDTIFADSTEDLGGELRRMDHARRLIDQYGGHVAESPKLRGEGYSPRTGRSWQQRWYNGNLMNAAKNHAIPESIHHIENPNITFSLLDTLSVCRDAAQTLNALHKGGMLHLDVTGANILIERERIGNRIHGRLADFGVSRPFGENPHFVGNCVTWDRSAQRGYPTPFTDVYTAIMTLALSVFGYDKKVSAYFENCREVLEGDPRDQNSRASLTRQIRDLLDIFIQRISCADLEIGARASITAKASELSVSTHRLLTEIENSRREGIEESPSASPSNNSFPVLEKHSPLWFKLRSDLFEQVIQHIRDCAKETPKHSTERDLLTQLAAEFSVFGQVYSMGIEAIYMSKALSDKLEDDPWLWGNLCEPSTWHAFLEEAEDIVPDAQSLYEAINALIQELEDHKPIDQPEAKPMLMLRRHQYLSQSQGALPRDSQSLTLYLS